MWVETMLVLLFNMLLLSSMALVHPCIHQELLNGCMHVCETNSPRQSS